MTSRPFLISIDVATSSECRDFEVQSSEDLALHFLLCVTTSLSAALPLILSRPRSVVATSCLFFINLWLPDLEFILRLIRSALNFSYVATGVLWSRP